MHDDFIRSPTSPSSNAERVPGTQPTSPPPTRAAADGGAWDKAARSGDMERVTTRSPAGQRIGPYVTVATYLFRTLSGEDVFINTRRRRPATSRAATPVHPPHHKSSGLHPSSVERARAPPPPAAQRAATHATYRGSDHDEEYEHPFAAAAPPVRSSTFERGLSPPSDIGPDLRLLTSGFSMASGFWLLATTTCVTPDLAALATPRQVDAELGNLGAAGQRPCSAPPREEGTAKGEEEERGRRGWRPCSRKPNPERQPSLAPNQGNINL